MSTHSRPDRVAQLIQQELAQIFARGLRDPRLGLVTITGCKISPDLRQARVYWTVHGDEKIRKDTKAGLDAARPFLRRTVGQNLSLRVVPELTFTYDEAIDRGDRVEQLLREAKLADQRRAEETAEQPAAESQEGATAAAQSEEPASAGAQAAPAEGHE